MDNTYDVLCICVYKKKKKSVVALKHPVKVRVKILE